MTKKKWSALGPTGPFFLIGHLSGHHFRTYRPHEKIAFFYVILLVTIQIDCFAPLKVTDDITALAVISFYLDVNPICLIGIYLGSLVH